MSAGKTSQERSKNLNRLSLTSTWHTSKRKVNKLHPSCILKRTETAAKVHPPFNNNYNATTATTTATTNTTTNTTTTTSTIIIIITVSFCSFLCLFTEDATKTLVTSYILSRLDYCNCLLMRTPHSVIQPLQTIQNFAARLVLLAPRHHHSTPLLEKLHWLPISERIKYKVACTCFSATGGSGPAYFSELLHVYTPSRTLRSSSDTRMLKIQQYKRKTHGFRTFSCFGPHI